MHALPRESVGHNETLRAAELALSYPQCPPAVGIGQGVGDYRKCRFLSSAETTSQRITRCTTLSAETPYLCLAAFLHATPHGVGNHAYSLTTRPHILASIYTSTHPHTRTSTHPHIHPSTHPNAVRRVPAGTGRQAERERPHVHGNHTPTHSRGQAVFHFHRNAWVELCHADGLDSIPSIHWYPPVYNPISP